MSAVSCYRQVLKIEPNRPDISVLLGELHANRGQMNNAVADYLIAGKLYVQSDAPHKALEVYERILHLNPKNACVRLRRAEIYVKQGLMDQGIREYLRIAKDYERSQKESEARSLYELVLQHVPGHAEATRRLSRIGLPGAEDDLAEPETERAPAAHFELVVDDDFLGLAPEKEKLAEVPSGNGTSHEDIVLEAEPAGEMYVVQDEAAPDRVVFAATPDPQPPAVSEEQQPESPSVLPDYFVEELEVQYELALAYKDMGLLDEAIETFERVLTSPSRFVDSCTMMAACYKDRQMNQAAIQCLERALRNPRSEGTLAVYVKHTLAQLYESEGQMQKAAQLYASIPAIRHAVERLRANEGSRHASGTDASRSSDVPEKARRISFF